MRPPSTLRVPLKSEDPMARRGGKAANRRTRQRRAQRGPQASAPAQPTAPSAPQPAPAPTGGDDAFDRADAELRASTPPPGTRPESAAPRRSVRARVSDFHMAGGSSRLTERAVAEYHYVGRDLRNIGILSVAMVVLLALAAIVVNLLGIGQAA